MQTRTPYLEAYLGRDGKDLEKFDLLWQYYVRISKFDQAAGILGALADSDLFVFSGPIFENVTDELNRFELTLAKRVEYLSLAVSNFKSQSSLTIANSINIDFLQEMEEKLEVALIQIEIYQSLPQGGAVNWEEKIEQRLFTITEVSFWKHFWSIRLLTTRIALF